MLLTYMCHDIIYIACHITINKSYSNLLQHLCCLAIAVIKNKNKTVDVYYSQILILNII